MFSDAMCSNCSQQRGNSAMDEETVQGQNLCSQSSDYDRGVELNKAEKEKIKIISIDKLRFNKDLIPYVNLGMYRSDPESPCLSSSYSCLGSSGGNVTVPEETFSSLYC